MPRYRHPVAAITIALLLVAAASDLRWDYALPFADHLPQSGSDADGSAVVAMVDDASFDATVETYRLTSLQRPDFDEHVLVYVTMVYGSCPPRPETVAMHDDSAVVVRLVADDPTVTCPQAGAVASGVIRLWRADLPAGSVPVRVVHADGTVLLEGVIENGPTLPDTGTRTVPYAGAGLLLVGLGAVLLRTTHHRPDRRAS